jgi:signal transduction histidine kinase
MIVDLRTFARPPQPKPTEVDAVKFCDEWARREAKRCEENDARLETAFEFAENAPTLTTDEAMLAAILNALTKNAIEATGPGGSIKIFARETTARSELETASGDNVAAPTKETGNENAASEEKKDETRSENARFFEIGVEDDGPGLSPEARELVFTPYFSGRQAGRGLGVGLAKARRFADALGVELACLDSTTFESGLCWRVVLRF